jgi:colanic acid/amylovoran biosynthesis glycosyltransferase
MIHYMTTNGVGNAWVAQELRVLARDGVPFELHSLIRPKSIFFRAEDIQKLHRDMNVLYPLSPAGSAIAALRAPFRYRGRFFGALWNALTGERESPRARAASIWHLFAACTWADHLRGTKASHIHSQWIHSGGTVAMYGAWLTGVPFSFTGHAADLFRERAALKDKIRRAEFIVCISTFHRDFFLEHGARPEQLITAYCGIDTKPFSPRVGERRPGRFRLVSAGRLVEKKGFDDLIRACAILRDRGLDFECTIGGSGPLEASLRRQVSDAKLEDRVRVTGTALDQAEVPGFMHDGDVYCLPCVWAADNDVDGLPQMLMEAMACGIPVISTRLVGIPDLVIHEKTGLLVEPRAPEALADAIARLAQSPDLRDDLAQAGREHVTRAFSLTDCLSALLQRYRAALEAS